MSSNRAKLTFLSIALGAYCYDDANTDDLFVRLGWRKLNLQRELKTATMIYKSL